MSVDVILEDDRWTKLGLTALADRAVQATLDHIGLKSEVWEVSLLACDDARITILNGEFRTKPQATNVLSWPSEDRANPGKTPELPTGDPELGDIAIAYETCMAEAKTGGKSPEDHVTHLIIHGLLHLLGYDHLSDDDAHLMESLEIAILWKLGLPNPYEG
jgi:probable rRNA maturation factor